MKEQDSQVTRTVFNQGGCDSEAVAMIKIFEEASKWIGDNPETQIVDMAYSFGWTDANCEDWICSLTIYHRSE